MAASDNLGSQWKKGMPSAEHPDFDRHVQNVVDKYNSASDDTKIGGHAWYRRAADDSVNSLRVGRHASDILHGTNSGQIIPGTLADRGKGTPGEVTEGARRRGATTFDPNHAHGNPSASLTGLRAVGQQAEDDYIMEGKRTGGMSEALDRAEHGLPQSRPSGAPEGSYLSKLRGSGIDNTPTGRRIANVAAMSPAGVTGMTWNTNVRASTEAAHLPDSAQEEYRAVNSTKPATPERKAGSEDIRSRYQAGKNLAHAGTPNVEKAMQAEKGQLPGNVVGDTKTEHFRNDITLGLDQNDAERRANPMHGTIDKHQSDVIAGSRSKWTSTASTPGAESNRGRGRANLDAALQAQNIPGLGDAKSYNYSRDVLHEASRRLSEQHGRDIMPMHAQAGSWGQQKMENDAAGGKGASGRAAQAQLADEKDQPRSPLSPHQFGSEQ